MSGDAMLYWGIGLLAATVLLLVLEAFIPSGGIIALTAAVTGIAGVVALFAYDTIWGVLGLVTLLVAGPAGFFWAIKTLPSTPIGESLLGGDPREHADEIRAKNEEQAGRLRGLIGAEGVAVTDLRPVGEVEVGGMTLGALAEHEYIESGSRVRVTGADGMELRVQPVA